MQKIIRHTFGLGCGGSNFFAANSCTLYEVFALIASLLRREGKQAKTSNRAPQYAAKNNIPFVPGLQSGPGLTLFTIQIIDSDTQISGVELNIHRKAVT